MADLKDDSDDGLSGAADFVQIYMFTIDIVGAHDIEKADFVGKSDPFCKLSAFATSYTTCTIRKTLNPVWNERVEMTFFNDPKQLRFELFDYDGGTQDDAIGDCVFNINESIYAPTNNGFQGKIKLQNCKTGELEIKVFARKLLPLEIEERLTQLHQNIESNEDNIQQLDESINDWNNKNAAVLNEINAINNGITATKGDITQKKQQLQDAKAEGERLSAAENGLKQEVNELEAKCNELKTKHEALVKKLEDIRIAEDKKRSENEQLREDMKSLDKRIKEKKEKKERKLREERQKRENEEKEKLKQDEIEATEENDDDVEEEEEEQEDEDRVMRPTPGNNDSDTKPLVDKHLTDTDKTGCVCCAVL